MKVIVVKTNDEPLTFKDLENHEKDFIYEHWLGLIKEFYKCNENRRKFQEWKERKYGKAVCV